MRSTDGDEPTAPPAPPTPVPPPTSPRSPGWWRRRTSWELFLHFFAVMLGVTAATAVTSWRAQRSLRETEVRAL